MNFYSLFKSDIVDDDVAMVLRCIAMCADGRANDSELDMQ